LYVYLMAESERQCTRELKRTDEEIHAVVGTPARTLCRARKRLAEFGLVQCQRIGGNRVSYVICDPITLAPYPGDPRQPARYLKRAGETKANDERPAQVESPANANSQPAPALVAPQRLEVRVMAVQEGKPIQSVTVQQRQADQCGETEPACPIHQNKHVYYDGDGKRHCQHCTPSPYAPSVDSPAMRTTRPQSVVALADPAMTADGLQGIFK
jgi:hypothetical protein